MLLVFAVSGCVRDTPPVSTPDGAVDEPVLQQVRRRISLPSPGTGDGVVVGTGESGKPLPVKTLLVTGRTSSSISLRWHDRSAIEDGTRIRRRETTGDWVEAGSVGPLTGFADFEDTGLSPDTLYCYSVVAFNGVGGSPSPQRCAYTRGREDRPVFRAQLQIETADIADAGTDDRVRVRLNSAPGTVLPAGNVTVVDYGHNDFQRGDTFEYDLELTGLTNLEDITELTLAKSGSDGWCVQRIGLSVNNRLVFAQNFSTTASGCRWLDDSGDRSPTHTVSHETLRAHPEWVGFIQPVPISIDGEEMEERVEGLIGHMLASNSDLKWGELRGRAWVEAFRKDAQTIRMDLDLEGDFFASNPQIDLEFDLGFRLTQHDDQWELDLTTANLETDASYNDFLEALAFVLPCGPFASAITGDGVANCIDALEKYVEDRIHRGFQPIARHFLLDSPCAAGSHPTVTVEGSEVELPVVMFGCAPD
jgi:hypothetical protein